MINFVEGHLELRLQVRKIRLAQCKLSFREDEYVWVFRVQIFYESLSEYQYHSINVSSGWFTLRFWLSFNSEFMPLTFQVVSRVVSEPFATKLNDGPVLMAAGFGAKKSNFGFFLVASAVSLPSDLRLSDIAI